MPSSKTGKKSLKCIAGSGKLEASYSGEGGRVAGRGRRCSKGRPGAPRSDEDSVTSMFQR